MKKSFLLIVAFSLGITHLVEAQKAKPEDTEIWSPVPEEIRPGKQINDPPSDAIILFGGKNLVEWASVNDPNAPAGWTVSNNVMTVNKSFGNIQTKRSFGSYQLHIEWKIPEVISETGQSRGNSGIFLASTGPGDEGYELQILDSYKNKTYVNGQAGSIYKQSPPHVNSSKEPGEWQSYDIVWTAPAFNKDGTLKTAAYATVFHNGVLIQNNTKLLGPTKYIGKASYNKAHGPSPIKLQSHGDPSEPISFRNIWIRELN